MLNLAFVVYRKWGYEIFKQILKYQQIRKDFNLPLLITVQKPPFSIERKTSKTVNIHTVDPTDEKRIHVLLSKHKIDIACFYSWSFMVGPTLLKDFTCLCLHPSLVPENRGGTPIQNQIMRGKENSGISIFKMSTIIDGGDLYDQTVMSLKGTIHDIFSRMIELGVIMTRQLIDDSVNGKLAFQPQKNLDTYPVLKRRKPSQSEIKQEELPNMTYQYLYNLVRGLLDPYPNAFIVIGREKLIILEVLQYKQPFHNSFIIDSNTRRLSARRHILFLKLKDSYAKISKSKIITQ